MNIIIIDRNIDRHKWHQEFWDTEYPDYNPNIVATLNQDELNEISCEIAIIHLNNDECIFFEENEDTSYMKIFFSGGTTSIKEYPDDNAYYVPQAHLPSFIKNKLNELGGL